MRAIVLFLVFVGATISSLGQTGNYFLSHYSPNRDDIDHLSFDIAQDERGVLYFANKAGVLQFDGRSWMLIPTTGPVYTVTVSSTGTLFAGGLSGFGRIADEEAGSKFEPLSANEPSATNIFQSASSGPAVYFLSNETLYILNAATGQVEVKLAPPKEHEAFTSVFKIEE